MFIKNFLLFIVTNHSWLGDSGIPTGVYLPEVAHAYHVLSPHFTIVFASPKGGVPPIDPDYPNDPISEDFLRDTTVMKLFNNSTPLDKIQSNDYVGLFYPGGHGPIFDLVHDSTSGKIAREIYEANGIVGAVCHGSAGLLNVKLSNGEYLIKGKAVTGFSNSEESEVDKAKYLPYALETELQVNGGTYTKAENWASHTVVDGRLVTGQNPQSAIDTANEFLNLFKLLKE